MQKVKHIVLVFENCEVVKLDPSMFRDLQIANVTKTYAVNDCQYKAGETRTTFACTSFAITINEKGLATKTSLPLGNVLSKRLEHRDISGVDLAFEDGTEESIYVPWGGGGSDAQFADEGRFTNQAQTHWTKDRTQVKIEIRK